MSRQLAVTRDVLIRARPSTVFRYLTDPVRFEAWFGPGSSIDPRPGGALVVAFPNGARAEGEIVEVEPDRRVVFTWGYPGPDSPLPPGASQVEVRLDEDELGTWVRLRHVVPTDQLYQAHVAGWRHHLSQLAVKASREALLQSDSILDRWYQAWSLGEAEREASIREICVPNVEFLDAQATIVGTDELLAHMANATEHLPGVSIHRTSASHVIADQLLCDWEMRSGPGVRVGRGRTVATVDLDGRLTRMVGFEIDQEVSDQRDVEPRSGFEPHVWARDFPRAVDWYQRVLGFEVDSRYPAEGEATWSELRNESAALMVAAIPTLEQAQGVNAYVAEVAARSAGGGPLSLYLQVDDAEKAFARATEAGALVKEPLWDPWWGGRQFTVEDPDGIWWTVRSG